MLKEFREFILRGNLIELAIAFVLGLAFAAVITAFVGDIITPIIAAIFGSHDFSNLSFTINGSRFAYGDFLNALISFVTIAAVLFFVVVRPVDAIMSRRKKEEAVEAPTRECPQCLSEIRAAASRCAFCAADVGPAPMTA
jgi:large conductance mechanosensitive channel